ncbi:hypothetical protein SAMN05216404_101388 [Nitrosospira multiformis]|uniref:Uncharacterized protein n=1 Tax=Nitrosospira multiformis TaxID=1231 RepID=A0A1H8BY18_9PROT|nr:hypothetical protein SAMN05216404_101388 [Nitrosospira multiformis]
MNDMGGEVSPIPEMEILAMMLARLGLLAGQARSAPETKVNRAPDRLHYLGSGIFTRSQ